MAVCLLVLCVNLITLALDALDLREQLGWLPYGVLTVESGSMEPAISRGDLLIVKEVPYAQLQLGDDVTFLGPEGFVTHRLVKAQGGRFVTQGLANAMADQLTMGPENYCGKVVGTIPLLGWVASLIHTSPLTTLLVTLLILMTFLGQDALEGLYRKLRQEAAEDGKKKKSYWIRALSCGALITLVVATPPMTEAKYVGQLYRYEGIVAQPMYFSSNYLSQEGNNYSIQGWTGNPYTLFLNVNNSDNVLLYNAQDVNLSYGIAVQMLEGGENYSVTLSTSAQAQENFPYPTSWEGYSQKASYIIPGGALEKHEFAVVIAPLADTTPKEGDLIRFMIYACTSSENTYFTELSGTFQLQVTEQTSFVRSVTVDDNGSMVSLRLETNVINDGSPDGEKMVEFKWDPQKMYINEYERTAFNAIRDQNGYFSKEEGILRIRLQAYSTIELEFFKRDSEFEAGPGDFTIRVEGEEAPADPTETQTP